MLQKPFRILAIAFTLFVSNISIGQKPYALKSYEVEINGTSSLHDWTSKVTTVDWTGQLAVEGGKLNSAKDVKVVIPVLSIKSEKGSIMDDKTYEAFKSDKNPSITYQLLSVNSTGGRLTAKGNLNMAGVSRTILLNLETRVLPQGDVSISGSCRLNMKDFKMEPPTAVMGTIKVGPMVTLLFNLVLSQS